MEYLVWIAVIAVGAYLAYKFVPAFKAKADEVKAKVEDEIKK